jgi:2-dehydropantoate 2-reductase
MTNSDPRIVVVGAGGLGGVFGGLLAEQGHSVTLLDINTAHIDAVRAAGGLRITGFGGDRLVPLGATSDPASLDQADVLLFLCKAGATRAAAQSVAHLLRPDGMAVTLQNGLGNEEQLGEILGADVVIAGLTAQGGRLEAPGVVQNFTELPTHIGELQGGISPRVQWLSRVFSAS